MRCTLGCKWIMQQHLINFPEQAKRDIHWATILVKFPPTVIVITTINLLNLSFIAEPKNLYRRDFTWEYFRIAAKKPTTVCRTTRRWEDNLWELSISVKWEELDHIVLPQGASIMISRVPTTNSCQSVTMLKVMCLDSSPLQQWLIEKTCRNLKFLWCNFILDFDFAGDTQNHGFWYEIHAHQMLNAYSMLLSMNIFE